MILNFGASAPGTNFVIVTYTNMLTFCYSLRTTANGFVFNQIYKFENMHNAHIQTNAVNLRLASIYFAKIDNSLLRFLNMFVHLHR